MKLRHALGICAVIMAAMVFVGCTAAQLQKAQTVSQTISTDARKAASATTQPMVQTIEAVVPAAAAPINLFGLIASGVATVFGLGATGLGALAAAKGNQLTQANQQLASATDSAATAHSAIDEIVSDIAAYKQPNEPWTTATEKLLIDLGHSAAALVTTA